MDDAPTWLIFDTDEDGVVWRRVSDGIEPLDLVNAHRSAGGHADPSRVLLWLQGKARVPWMDGDGVTVAARRCDFVLAKKVSHR